MLRALRIAPAVLVVLATVALANGCSGGGSSTSGASRLDAAKVPEGLRKIVPLAQRWGIGDDVDRGEALSRVTPEERAELRRAVETHGAEITAWLDSFGGGEKMSEEAAAFMYMQLAVEELRE
jgi:hypothetical protein